ncbi:MAG: putative metal-binding motif-containing protein, partial [Phycisphaerales bacterium]
DGDADGYTGSNTALFCTAPAGYESTDEGDCNDASNAVYPGAPELCANLAVDNDCDGSTLESEASDRTAFYADGDADGYTGSNTALFCTAPEGYRATNEGDCNDGNASINPGAAETCANLGTDNDCDGINNAAEASDATEYYRDSDGDGFGSDDPADMQRACSQPEGFVTNSQDANDSEVTYDDADGDGFGAGPMTPGGVTSNTDCNDNDDSIYPGAPELCSNLGVNNDCDGDNSEAEASDRSTFYRDADGDGYTGSTTALFCNAPAGYRATNEGDCDDGSTAINPGAAETCANLGTDNDCDGINNAAEASDATEYYIDADGDGFGADDAAPVLDCSQPTGYVENNLDSNDAAKTYADEDEDGFGAGPMTPGGSIYNTDCNDNDNAIYPGAVENCANLGVNNDCDGDNSAAEAVDATNYYVDGDSDSFG